MAPVEFCDGEPGPAGIGAAVEDATGTSSGPSPPPAGHWKPAIPFAPVGAAGRVVAGFVGRLVLALLRVLLTRGVGEMSADVLSLVGRGTEATGDEVERMS